LGEILTERGVGKNVWNDSVREDLVQAWHNQQAWPDSIKGLQTLCEQFMVVVLANGTTRLQLDIIRSSGLPFHTLFSSQLLQVTKPNPVMYLKALELLKVEPSKAAMVAAHAYDLRAAAKLGMKTIYIQRSTEDPDENMETVRTEVDLFIDGRQHDGGLMDLSALYSGRNLRDT